MRPAQASHKAGNVPILPNSRVPERAETPGMMLPGVPCGGDGGSHLPHAQNGRFLQLLLHSS